MNQGLRVSYEPNTDGTGKLIVEVSSGGFSGFSSAWFHERELLEFARVLAATYPLPQSGLPSIRGGYWSESNPKELAQPHVEIVSYPIGSLGSLGLRVELATPGQEVKRSEQRCFVAVELVTSYEPVGAFARALEAVVLGQAQEAWLEGHGT